MKVSYQGNVTKNIFDADIKSLIDTNIFITRLDGPSYDSGVGFEIGYCLGNEIPIYIFNSDFYENKLVSQFKYKMTPILDKISNVYTYQYKNNERLNYDEELDYNTSEFSNFITEKLNDSSEKIHKIIENEEKYDIFIDFLGSKYEWCNVLVEKIVEKLKQYNIKYCISDRYSSDYNIEKELINLKNSRLYLTCYDENEPDLDSSILQGFAYYNNLDIIGYESNPVIYYVEGK